ncbi:MAG TPA: hypothetical protein VIU61_05445 [Kofleriaceae bacterium]
MSAAFKRRLRAAHRAGAAKPERVAEAAAWFGVKPHRDLAAVLEVPNARWKQRFGHWCAGTEPLPTKKSSLVELVNRAYTHPFAIVSSFTGLVWIGNDGGGQEYLVDVESSAVYMYGPGVGQLKFLADSLDSFLALNEMAEKWDAYEREHGIDYGEIESGDIDPATLKIPEIRRAMAKLKTRVSLPGYDNSDMTSDFDEIYPAITGIRPRAKPASPTVLRLHQRSYWIQMNLRLGPMYQPGEALGIRGKGPIAKRSCAADMVYRLWDPFMQSRDAELAAECTRARSEDALLVRRTAELFEAVLSESTPGELGFLRSYRAAVAELSGKAPAARTNHTLLAPSGGDSAALAAARAQAKNIPGEPKAWDGLCYELCNAEAWEQMKEAAEARLALARVDHYPWLQLGIARHQLGNHAEAIIALDRALAFDRHTQLAGAIWFNKAEAYAALGNTAEARTHLSHAIRCRADLAAVAAEMPALAALVRISDNRKSGR